MRVPGDIIAGTNGDDVEACWTERFNSQGQEAHTPGNYSCLNLNIFTTDLENRESTRMKHRMFVAVDYEGDGSDQPDFKTADQTVKLLQQRAEKKNSDQPFFIAAGFVRPHYPSVAPQQYFEPYPYESMPLPESVPDDLDDIPAWGKKVSTSASTGIENIPTTRSACGPPTTPPSPSWMSKWARYSTSSTVSACATPQRSFSPATTAIISANTPSGRRTISTRTSSVCLSSSTPRQRITHRDAATRSLNSSDIYPTACDLSGVAIPDSVEGKSLVPVLADPDAEIRNAARSFANGGTSLRSAGWAYMRYKDGSEELYDMRADPEQFTNLANDPQQTDRLKDFRSQLGQ